MSEQDQSSTDQTDHVAKLTSVARYLFWVSGSWAVLMGLGVVGTVLMIALNQPEGDDFDFMLQNGIYNVVFGAYSFLICAGAYQMMRTRAYSLSVAAAIMSCVPLLSPWIIIGIPMGIWSAILLFKPEVKAAFAVAKVDDSAAEDPAGQTLQKACAIVAGILIWVVVFNVIGSCTAIIAGQLDFDWEKISSSVMGLSHLIGILAGVFVAKLIMPKSLSEDVVDAQDPEEPEK